MADKKAGTKRPASRKKAKPETEKTKNHHYEFQLLGLLGFTGLSAVSLHSHSAGALGVALKQLYFGLFASAGYAMPYLILVAGFLAINRHFSKIRARWVLAAVLTMLSILIVVTLAQRQFMPTEYFTLAGLKQAHISGVAGQGGGVIGTLITGIFLSTIGVYGSYVLVLCMILAILMLTTSFTITRMGHAVKGTAIKTGEVIVDANRNLIQSMTTEPEEGPVAKKHHSIMKLMRHEQFDKTQETVPEETPAPKFVPDVLPAEDPVEAALPFIINKDDQLEIPIIESAPPRPAKPRPAPVKPAPVEPVEGDETVAIEISENEWPNYELPSTELLNPVPDDNSQQDKKEILANAKLLEETLSNFGIEAKVVQISRGPAITRYELQPSPGVKVSRIVSLSDDIALNLAAQQVRIVAPIPGKAAVGIEVPNKSISMVALREVLESDEIQDAESKLAFSLGKDISGNPIVADLAKMPHLLVAGSTGSGKSVCINTIISSILFRARPDEVKFLMIDPKVVELNIYNGIPHLILPVVTDPKKASIALNWAVQEMTDRYKLFAEAGVRDITGYNRKLMASGKTTGIPKIVVIIDELADLMMVAPNAVEDAICRLAQMARAAGIHLIVATQRPSVDVITGVIKANVPSRIAFAVSSMMDSRTIIDMGGAEKLLGKGDMLYYPVGVPKPMRVQGSFISDTEVEDLIHFIKSQVGEVSYNPEILDTVKTQEFNDAEADEFLEQAIEFVVASRQASASLLQRKFRVGYNRAARLIDSMEERGIIGPSMGSKPREVLISADEYDNLYEEEEEI